LIGYDKSMRPIKLANPSINFSDKRAVLRVLNSGNLAQGRQVELFEKKFSELHESREAVAVNSGTSGLLLGLLALGIGKGDEVLVPSFTFAASANAIALTGAKPVFVDISLDTYCIDPMKIKAAISKKTKAILVVHLYGYPSDMHAICEIASANNLKVIEDAAQAHLASIEGKLVGTFGDLAVFSFYPTKNMTSGEGGMIITQYADVARKCRLLRNQGMEVRYQNEVVGYNMRMTDIHAALGSSQFSRLESWTQAREANADFYLKHLEIPNLKRPPHSVRHSYHQFTIMIPKNREGYISMMSKNGIGTGVYYPTPVHRLPPFAEKIALLQTEIACERVVSIPVHPGLKKGDLKKIVGLTNQFLGSISD
jgi:perosamine synthetase